MPTKVRDDLKKYFENGDKPSEEQFSEFIDSVINIESDEVFVDNLTKNVGLGINSPTEKLDVDGAIKIGNASNTVSGTIRWTGTDFEGYTGTEWKSLTRGGELANLYLPVPRLCVKGKNTLYVYWEDHNDLRFKSYSPKWYLYRYKGSIKQLYADSVRPTRIKSKKWVHTQHLHSNSSHGSTTRNTEFSLPANPNAKKKINFNMGSYFKRINGIMRPRGQGRFSYGINKGHYNRRFEYFKLRTVIEVEGKKHFGPFSEIFAVGERKGNTNLIIQLAEPSYFGLLE